MIIKSLYISRLFNQYSYTLNLCDGLTFIHSPNGFGKSTLMHMVYAAMKGDVKFLSEIPFERLDIGYCDESNLIIEKESDELLIQMQKNELETQITPEEMGEICDVTYISPERLMVKKRDGHVSPALETYAQELYERIRYSREHAELAPYTGQRKEMSDSELEFWCKDLKAKLDFIKDAGFEPDIPAGYRFPPSRYELINYRKDYEDLAYSVSEYVNKNYILAESIIIFKDVINEFFIGKEMEISENGKIVVNLNGGGALQLSKLSSGEKQIMIIFYNLLFHADPGTVVILDEPEISLHITWQQKLGKIFSDICRVRNVQVIVATHSPQVIHDMWDNAREMKPSNA
ncbi:MAG: ATP-binding protein [Candidatus Methanomethylophilaceae archaeon]|nr:ATP-binding protein [Candidatus Methanomethylophilaceae archaeon]